MTTRVQFASVVKTLKEYAFKYSPYPLILSLEVHCSAEQQDVMAAVLKSTFDDQLLTVPDDYSKTTFYPSPEEL